MVSEQESSSPRCGRTEAVSGRVHEPCVRDAEHREAFCRSANGDLFIAIGAGRAL
jgi:hypothetical protein